MCKKDIDSKIESQTEEEVIDNFKKACLYDPLPFIPPALLNHIDIKKYIYTAGILFPYNHSNLKGVTYRIPLLGDIYYWEENDKGKLEQKHILLEEKVNNPKKLILKKNSITYIHISTTFRVPYYLVYRFNLTVDLAHKGLLLGTGPIIDPGFEGRIMIPIHNLTANDYELQAGSGLIRVEFTKLSPEEAFDRKKGILLDNYKCKFPDKGKYWDEYTYFKNIYANQPIISSIPDAMNEVKKEAKAAKEEAKLAKRTVTILSIGAAIGLLISVGGIVISGYTLLANVITPTLSLIDSQKTLSVQNNTSIETLENNIKALENKINQLEKKLSINQNKNK